MLETDGEQSFGAQLRRYRLAANLTQAALAEKAGISTRAIQDLERGLSRPLRDTVFRLMTSLDLTPDEQARLRLVASPGPRRHAPAVQEVHAGVRPLGRGEQHNLPLQQSSLVGRDRDLEALQKMLARREVRLVTLTGPGGVGKTRLALALAECISEQFVEGVWFVDLSGLRDPDLVVTTIANTLELRDVGVQPVRPGLADALRDRTMLLVLDNFEQVLGAAPDVADLLRGCPRIKVVATSREPLGLRWEHLFVVQPLDVPDNQATASLPSLREVPAVSLFIDRAQAADAAFELTAANARDIADLCNRLDGLPLALELAAARVRSLPPHLLLKHLAQRLDLLTGARDAPPRQQSLRATLDWSYGLLSGAEQGLLRGLAVFAGGATLDAVEAVSGKTRLHVLDGLASLSDKHLVCLEVPGAGEPRYRLLETVRAYALEQLAGSVERNDAIERHARYYLALVERPSQQDVDHFSQVAWLEALERELDNLRAAMRRLLEDGDSAAGFRFTVALDWFWSTRCHLSEGRSWFAAFLTLPELGPLNLLRARALNSAGSLANEAHDCVPARALHEEALAIARALDHGPGICAALRGIADIARWSRDYSTADTLYQEALTISRERGLHTELAQTLHSLGSAALEEGDYSGAQRLLEESLELFRRTGSLQSAAQSQFRLGRAAFARGDDAGARAWLAQGAAMYMDLNAPARAADVNLYLGLVALRLGELVEADALFTDCLASAQRECDVHASAYCFEAMACLAAAQEQPERALRLVGAAGALRAEIGISRTSFDSVWLDKWLIGARKALGENLASAALTAGGSMSLARAVEYALATTPDAAAAHRRRG